MITTLILLTVAAEPPPVVALSLQVKGEILVTRGDKPPRRLEARSQLRRGDRLELRPGAMLVAAFADGLGFQAAEPVTLTVTATGFDPPDRVKPYKTPPLSVASRRQWDAGLRTGGVVLKSDGADTPDIKPSPDTTVLQDRPAFAWPVKPGATGYVITLFQDDRPLWERPTSRTTMPFPADVKPLERSERYRWVVKVSGGTGIGAEAGSGSFEVLDAESARSLTRDVEALKATGEIAELQLAAELLESYLAFDDALVVHESLAKAEPENPSHLRSIAALHERAGDRIRASAARQRAEKLERSGAAKPAR
jgi:hypothetical protein